MEAKLQPKLLTMDFSNMNWLAIIAAAAAYFVLGAIWFGPVFGEAWVKGTGLTEEQIKSGGHGKMLGTAFTMSVVVSFGMAMFFFGNGIDPENPMTLSMGAMYGGAMSGIFFVLPTKTMDYVMAQKPGSLILIESLYHIVAFTIVGIILGVWQ